VLRFFRRHWLVSALIAVVLAGGIVAVTMFRRSLNRGHDEPDVSIKAEAPPDLEKLRDTYAAGVAALQRNDGVDAVKHFSSFTFGTRAIEEYRLYYLANGYQLAGDVPQARVTLARLFRRTPRMIYAHDAAFNLAALYENAGDFAHSAEVYATLARHADGPDVAAAARWQAAVAQLQAGDVAGALFNARAILIDAPAAKEAGDASALVRSITGAPDTSPLPFTHSERLARAEALIRSGKPDVALTELITLEADAPELKTPIVLQRGIALNQLRRYEDSNKVLEPLTSGQFKYAIPALRYGAKNYAIVAASINPEVIKTVKERKKVGTVKQRVGKGKKRRTVTKPKYQTVFKQVKLIDLPKKQKKDEYERLASERLKDLLSLPEIDDDVRVETLTALIDRAAAKNQDAYLQQLVPQLIKLDPSSDPALQHFWDKGWAAYARGDLPAAKAAFDFIRTTYTHANVRRQSEYWYARTIDRQGQKDEAKKIYQQLASAPYEDIYAQHAVKRGAKRVEPSGSPLDRKTPDWREVAEKQMPKELEIAYELTSLSQMRDAMNEIRGNLRRENTRMANALLADIYHSSGSEVPMYTALRKAWPQLATIEQDQVPLYFFRMYYPLKYGEEIEKYAKKNGVDPNLVRGLILQESYYNPEAKSRVGATGLMQLMPPTAAEHARSLHIAFAASRLTSPGVNIELGTFHLRMRINMFGGNAYMAVASYNAGQGNVMKWKRAAPSKPTDEFLESIPFQETRNYVKRVTMLRSTYARLTS
jgi:soluble lytic murein transglycosylase